jgi:hypothetical protein
MIAGEIGEARVRARRDDRLARQRGVQSFRIGAGQHRVIARPGDGRLKQGALGVVKQGAGVIAGAQHGEAGQLGSIARDLGGQKKGGERG